MYRQWVNIWKSRLRWLTVAWLFLLNSCAAQDCNPHSDPGFFSTLHCHASGGYSGRVSQMEQTLQKEQNKHIDLTKELSEREQQQQQIRQTLTLKEQELAALEQEWQAVQSRLKQTKTRNATLNSQIAQTSREIERLKTSTQADTVKSQEIKRLRKKLVDLKSALEKAM